MSTRPLVSLVQGALPICCWDRSVYFCHLARARAINCPVLLNPPGILGGLPCHSGSETTCHGPTRGPNASTEFLKKQKKQRYRNASPNTTVTSLYGIHGLLWSSFMVLTTVRTRYMVRLVNKRLINLTYISR